jgi:hypothetical protein
VRFSAEDLTPDEASLPESAWNDAGAFQVYALASGEGKRPIGGQTDLAERFFLQVSVEFGVPTTGSPTCYKYDDHVIYPLECEEFLPKIAAAMPIL